MPISRLDEYLIHQMPTTIDHVDNSDPRFFERSWIAVVPDGRSELIVSGIGWYPNGRVTQGFLVRTALDGTLADESFAREGNPALMRVGTLNWEVLEGLVHTRVQWRPSSALGTITGQVGACGLQIDCRFVAPFHTSPQPIASGELGESAKMFLQTGTANLRDSSGSTRGLVLKIRSWGVVSGAGDPHANSSFDAMSERIVVATAHEGRTFLITGSSGVLWNYDGAPEGLTVSWECIERSANALSATGTLTFHRSSQMVPISVQTHHGYTYQQGFSGYPRPHDGRHGTPNMEVAEDVRHTAYRDDAPSRNVSLATARIGEYTAAGVAEFDVAGVSAQ